MKTVKEESSNSSEEPSSSNGKTDGQTNNSDSSSSFSLARAETRAVNRSKLLVLVVIAIAAAVLAGLVYFLIDRDEQILFQHEFKNLATEISDLVHFEAKDVYESIELLSMTVTSFALARNLTWPNITVPHFEIHGEGTNKLSQALQVSFVPLIKMADKASWEAYAVEHSDWLAESLFRQEQVAEAKADAGLRMLSAFPEHIWRFSNETEGDMVVQDGPGVDFGPGNFAALWQQGPASNDPSILLYDVLSHPVFRRVYHGLWESRLPVLTEALRLDWLYDSDAQGIDSEHPQSILMSPVYPTFKATLHERDELVGILLAILPWDIYFTNLLANGANGIQVVLHSTCDEHFTYRLDGPTATFIGTGDLHDTRYDHLEVDTEFAPFLKHNFSGTYEHCEYDLRIFPTSSFEASYRTNKPGIYTAVVVLVFFVTAMTFVLYDYLVQRRQDKVMATAKRTNAIVSSLFPSNVRDRILKDAEEQADQDVRDNKRASIFKPGAKSKLKDFLDEGAEAEKGEVVAYDTKPIADLFPNVTVMFADIVGFTAWSSVREPSQVFTLLETLFAAFDDIAKRRRVFKVETVGDCYVAVAGLPDPRKDHAIVMARFARDVLYKMNDLTKRLETTLGPDTGELALRIGLHSGQVTAGVLRGDKSRFQLFGDTMNTASRIEASGLQNRIHLSVETAGLIIASGRDHWVEVRENVVEAKGKGVMQTFWLTTQARSVRSQASGEEQSKSSGVDPEDAKWVQSGLRESTTAEPPKSQLDEKADRLVKWNVDVLSRLLKHVSARRRASNMKAIGSPTTFAKHPGETVLDEVQEIICLPEFDSRAVRAQVDPDTIVLDEEVTSQLQEYVTIIATMYRDNPFHNFEHASHVTMSVVKLLSRIVAPDLDELNNGSGKASTLHDHTYGITSDPLTQFACVYAALIHDVDHYGVPNAQLVKEQTPIAVAYKEKSVAEQNSVDIAWDLLMEQTFVDLRNAIFSNDGEQKRFRQLVVNSVMATDIVDKELKGLRNARWEKAFQEEGASESVKDTIDRKATIVIEHLIQASDVAHTMQHWHIYRKWNERLFEEMYKAYKIGRAEKDPSDFWYHGEIGFFDYYIIPLAKKLKDCGVFGVASDEYLNYAEKNRNEWEARGKEVVSSMTEKYSTAYEDVVPEQVVVSSRPVVSALFELRSGLSRAHEEGKAVVAAAKEGAEDEIRETDRTKAENAVTDNLMFL